GTYIQLIVYYLLCLAVFAVSLRAHGGPALLFWTGMLMPLFVLFVTYLKIHFDRLRGDLRQFQTQHWVAFSLAALALLTLSILTLPQLPVDVRFFIVGSVLVGLGLLFLPPITELLSSPSALRPQQAYLLAATLLLAVLAIPPAASFFKLSCDIPVENLVKLGQVGFLRAFEMDPELLGGTGSPARMVYTSAFFSTFPYRSRCDGRECLHGREREPRLHDSWLLQQLERVLPDYNGSATAMAKLTADVVPERTWQWEHVKNGRLVLHGPVTDGAGALHLESTLPSLAFSLVRWVWLAVGLCGLGVVVIGLMWFLVRNLLLLNVEVPSWLQRVRDGGKLSISALGGNLFFISRRADLLQRIEAQMETGIIHIDLEKEPIRSGKWLSAPSVAGKEFVLINHFEHRLDDVDFNRAKLHLLESLSRDSGRRLVVLSSVDPYLCFVNGSLFSGSGDAAGERARWMSLLADCETFDLDQQVATGRLEAALDSFRRSSERKSIPWPKAAWSRHTRACLATLQEDCCVTAPLQLIGEQLLPDLDLERMGRAEIVDEVRERAELYYRALWSSLTDLEKTTLFQLAEEGLVNPKNRRPLQRLLARGLVVRKPAPRLMNESFRRFVMSGTCRREARELERRCEARGNWSRLQPFFSAVLLGVVGFLYVTQREAFDSTLLFLTALAGAMPHVLKLVGVFGAAQVQTDAEA
ncbi:MAG TPA: hypothetical protein VFJ65_08690, partial [Solirubrobacterales bacterium]|nr:hypothetical protein [Solirubrobacterales bacterium]